MSAVDAHNDTIVAIATPPGPGLRGVVRVSGSRASALWRALWVGDFPGTLARGAHLGRIHDGRGEQPVLVLWMPAPRSFTREDVVEFHLPGSPPLLDAALARLVELGARSARPGEFTRRAFESGRIDLLRAEGVLALVAARNAEEARAASALFFGGLGERVAAARAALDELRASCEASLDFDELDTGHIPAAELDLCAARLADSLASALEFEHARTPSAGLPRVVLVGAPNAGKSTLFNRLCGRDEALVSAHSGTTRDALHAELELDGCRVRLSDTAGLEAQARGPDQDAQRVATAERAAAALCVWVVDAARARERSWLCEREVLPAGVPFVVAWNKLDVPGTPREPDAALGAPWVGVSAESGAGVVALARTLRAELEQLGFGGVERELAARHLAGLASARAELARARAELAAGMPLELFAEHLRVATEGLDQLTGQTTAEDLLDRIFARFCLGK